MFLPMSWTSPFTVAMSTRPLVRVSALAASLRLDERDQVRDRLSS